MYKILYFNHYCVILLAYLPYRNTLRRRRNLKEVAYKNHLYDERHDISYQQIGKLDDVF
jgi:hypothetical protein